MYHGAWTLKLRLLGLPAVPCESEVQNYWPCIPGDLEQNISWTNFPFLICKWVHNVANPALCLPHRVIVGLSETVYMYESGYNQCKALLLLVGCAEWICDPETFKILWQNTVPSDSTVIHMWHLSSYFCFQESL